ncbi:MAG: TolB-like protein [Kiritimatiellia bacterium]|jgi:TolB-like protein
MQHFMFLLFFLWPTAALAVPTIAILDLENDSGDQSLDPAGAGVASILTSRFSKLDSIRLVERTDLQALLEEVDLGQSGAVDKATAARAGKILGADYLVLGSMYSLRLPNLGVALRIVNTETGQVVLSEDVLGEIGNDGGEFFVLIDELAFRVIGGLQLKLSTRDRINISQVDVQKLETVQAFGGAIQALDAGDTEKAEGLLAKALSLEPGFKLAESTLKQIAAEIRTTRSTFASADVKRAHLGWKAIRTWVDANKNEEPTSLELQRRAAHSRLLLIEGDIPGHIKAEEQRIAWTTAHLDVFREQSLGHSSALRVDDLLIAAGVPQHAPHFHGLVFWPWQIRLQMAHLRNGLGQTDRAIEMVLDIYQHPGPLLIGYHRLTHPIRELERLQAADVVVLFRRQRLQQAKLGGHVDDAHKALKELESAVKTATQARERDRRWEQITANFSKPPTDLSDELSFIRTDRITSPDYSQYRAFRLRIDEGYYAKISKSEPDDYAALCHAWHKVAQNLFGKPWFADLQIEHTLALHQQLPATTDEERDKQQAQLEKLAHQVYAR